MGRGNYTYASDTKNGVLMVMLGLLLFLPPYFRGLYFETEFQYFHIATAILFLVYLAVDRKKFLSDNRLNVLDINILLFVFVYIISLAVAANLRDAVGEVFRYLNYLLIYYIIVSISNSGNSRNIVKVLYFSGVGVSLIGLGAAFGLMKVVGGYVSNQIASTLGYSNSLGGYLLPVLILGLFLIADARETDKKPLKYIYSTANFVVLLTFIGTVSRGAFLVVPIALLLLILLAPKGARLIIFKYTALLFAVVVLFSPKILKVSLPEGRNASILWLLVGLIIFNVLIYFLGKFGAANLKLNKKTIYISVIIIAAAALLLVFANYMHIVSIKDILPTRVVEKFSTAGLNTRFTQERFVFYKDALKIVRDYPVLGTGGGGWTALYTQYQSYLYASKSTHSQLFQIWVETGTLGLLVYLFLWVALIFVFWKLLKKDLPGDEKLIIVAVGVSVIAVLMHGLMDFDLSLGAISILLWSLIAILSSCERRYRDSGKRVNMNEWFLKITKGAVVVGAIILMLASASFSLAFSYAKKGAESVNKWTLPEAVTNYREAAKYDPLKGSYAADMAQSLHYLGDPVDNFAMVREAKKYAVTAEELDLYNPKIRNVKAKIQLSLSEIPQAVKEYEQAVALVPWDQTVYDNLAEIYFRVGKYYSLNRKPQEAKRYFEKTKTVPDMVNKQLSKLDPKYRSFWVSAPMLGVSPSISNSVKSADEMLKQLR